MSAVVPAFACASFLTPNGIPSALCGRTNCHELQELTSDATQLCAKVHTVYEIE